MGWGEGGREGRRERGADLSSEVVRQTGKVGGGLEWEGVEIQVKPQDSERLG